MRKAVFISALFVSLALSGCTGQVAQRDPTPSVANTPTVESPAPLTPDSVVGVGQLPKSGDFVSQGAATAGTATLTSISEYDFSITLDNFSTGPGDDLRLRLSTGELVQGADGNYYVDGNSLELPGDVDTTLSNQTFTFGSESLTFGEFRSLTVYDYTNRVALGSAALD
jgi:Electron transfer DM13